jgi:hypothetical protein
MGAGLLAPTDDAPATVQAGSVQAALRLPCVVRVLNLVLFGDGRHWWLPVLLTGGTCAYYLSAVLRFNQSGALMWYDLAAVVEITVNTYFGYRFCRAGRITELVRTVAEPHGVTEGDAARTLAWCAWIAIAACAAIRVWAAWLDSTDVGGLRAADGVAVYTYAYLCMFYLCSLWLWTNWLFWRAGRGAVGRSISASSVAQWRADAAVFGLLDEMRSASRVWTTNHAVRAVTTVVLAEARLQFGSENPNVAYLVLSATPKFQRAFNVTAAAALFLLVLSTAAAPGYVTTDFYREVQRKLATVVATVPHQTDDGGGGDGGSDDGSCERSSACRRRSRTKAVTVATLIFYLTRHFATPACLSLDELPAPPPWWNGTAVVHAHL